MLRNFRDLSRRTLLLRRPPRRRTSDNASKDSVAAEPQPPVAAESVFYATQLEASTVEQLHRGAIWFSHLYPLKRWRYDPRHRLFDSGLVDGLLKRLMAKMDSQHHIQVIKVVNRAREGGAFVHFESALGAKDTVKAITEFLRAHHSRSWLTREQLRSYLVRGRPFLHDMDVYPTRQIRIDFRGEPIELEELYEALRTYGTVNRIVQHSKDAIQPHAIASFANVHGATAAINCLHGTLLHGTKLRIAYQPFLEASRWREWLSSNSRIIIPLLISAAAAFTYAIFDPVRVFFITNKITGRFELGRTHPFGVIQTDMVTALPVESEQTEETNGDGEAPASAQAQGALGMYKTEWIESVKRTARGMYRRLSRFIDSVGEQGLPVWSKASYQQLYRLLENDQLDELILVAGAAGTGKTSLVRSLVDVRANVVHIDLRHSDVVLDDKDVVSQIKRCVGFFPNLSLLHSLQAMSEKVMAISSRGVVAPTSSSETEVRHILKCVTSALKSVRVKDKEAGLPPVIVLNGLNSVFFTDHPGIAQTMVEWAEAITAAGFGHVLVLCDDNVAEDLENRPTIKTSLITLDDGTSEQSAQLLRESLKSSDHALDEQQLQEAVRILGGRLGDIHETLVRCNHGGQHLGDAINDVVHGATSFVQSHMLGIGGDVSKEVWSKEQAWLVVKELHQRQEVRYERLLFSPEFHGSEPALHALQRAGLISIVRRSEPMSLITRPGVPDLGSEDGGTQGSGPPSAPPLQGTRQKLYVRPARPVFREAFRRLVTDPNLGSGIELLVQEQRDAEAVAKLSRAEAELKEVLSLMAAARRNEEGSVADALRSRAGALAADIRRAAEHLEASREKCSMLVAFTSQTPDHEGDEGQWAK